MELKKVVIVVYVEVEVTDDVAAEKFAEGIQNVLEAYSPDADITNKILTEEEFIKELENGK